MLELNGQSKDIVAENIVKIREIFPEVCCEDKIDFERLQEVLGEYIEDKEERYRFEWHGKSKAIRLAQTLSTGTLRPSKKYENGKDDSKNWGTTENLYIEGDNLEILKLLQKTYHNSIKMIYIDPPYNTGKDFVYSDNYKDNLQNYLKITRQLDEEGRKKSTNSEASGRYHTDWLNMMYPRLRLARNLLTDDGVIFINIDDNEVDNLKKICDEIFGVSCFIANAIWRSKDNSNNDAKRFSTDHNYTLIYSRKSDWQPQKIADESKRSHFKNPDNNPKGPYFDGNPLNSPNYRENLRYSIVSPQGININPPKNGWRWSKETLYEKIETGEVRFTPDGKAIRRRTYLCDMKGLPPSSLWIDLEKTGHNRQAKYELLKMIPEDIFDTPKPVKLIRYVMQLANICDNDIILDFFSGSSTTAHATMQLNAEDGDKRKFIMVQLPEQTDEKSEAYKAGYKNICEIGKERIRRAGKKIIEENKDKEGIEDLDIGFKVFKLDSSNLKKWNPDYDNLEYTLDDMVSNFVDGRTEEDVLYEIMLKYGIDLTYPIETKVVNDKKVFIIGFGALFVCHSEDITIEIADFIANRKNELKPDITRVVFKDNGFKNDSVKTNIIQILNRNNIDEIMSV